MTLRSSKDVDDIKLSIDALGDDVDILNDAVNELKRTSRQGGQVSPEQAAAMVAVEKKTQDLADRLQKLTQELNDLKKAPGPAAAADSGSGREKEPARSKAGKQPATAEGATDRTPAPPAKVDLNPKAKGSYYTVKEGDTIESIAVANGVTAVRLRAENMLPSKLDAFPSGPRYSSRRRSVA